MKMTVALPSQRPSSIQLLANWCTAIALSAAAFWIVGSAAPTALAQTSVLTQHNDNARTGQNTAELLLAPSNVNSGLFGKLFTQSVDGLVVGQPLVVPNLSFPDGSTHNVVYVVTQHDTVYAFDADSNEGTNSSSLWTTSFGNPDLGITSVPIANFGCKGTGFTEVGITGTPVIDPASGTIYVVAKTLENGLYLFRLHALDLTTGQEKFGGPVVISGTAGSIVFDATPLLQRPGLLLSNGVIYVAFGGNGCDTYQYRGWVAAYDAQQMTQLALFLASSIKKGAGIWQSGAGIAADENGDIYFATGNGIFDASTGGNNYGDSVLRLRLGSGVFDVIDYFSPADQNFLRTNDLDLGGGGVIILPDQGSDPVHEIIAGGKEGTAYVLNRDALGQFDPVQDDVVQELAAAGGQLQSVPVYWNNNVYITGSKDFIKLFPLTGGLLSTTPAAQTLVKFDKPGNASLSANGQTSGILWALLKGNHILYAFDATNLTTLYSSAQVFGRDSIGLVTHFVTPTVANGKVYVGGLQQLTTFGLFAKLAVVAGDAQTGVDGTTLPTALQIQASDTYTGNPLAGRTVTCKDGGAGGVFSNMPLLTDSSGLGSFTYTLPKKALTIAITCSSTSLVSAVFTETSIPGPPTRISIKLGNFQTAPPSTTLPTPLTVRVADANNVAVPGVPVDFTDNGVGGIISATPVTSDNSGMAATSYTTPPSTGTVKVTASTSGVPSVKFTVTVQ